jgi:pimeloyl-ACP methyl ester carboxylesterase
MGRIRAIKQLVHDAVDLTVKLVEEGHESAARNVMRALGWIEPIAGPARLINEIRRASTSGVLGSVRLVNRTVERLLDAGLVDIDERAPSPIPMRSDAMGSGPWFVDSTIAALNGAVGDYLHRQTNELDLGMKLRHRDAYLALERDELAALITEPTPRCAIFVHGLGASEWSWCWNAVSNHGSPEVNFGTLLHDDLGYVPFFARYNSGRHVSENGRLLAAAVQRLHEAYPAPLEEILLIGHSMGGLVVRSACHYAQTEGRTWVERVRRVFSLGSPHQGAPAEKASHLAGAILHSIDLPSTRIPAELLRRRSSGIKDMRLGSVVDEDWLGRDPDALSADGCAEVPLLDSVAYHFLSATVTRDPEHPLGQLVGDILVRVPSASGPVMRGGDFAIRTRSYGGVLHHELQNHPDVYAQIRQWLSSSGV